MLHDLSKKLVYSVVKRSSVVPFLIEVNFLEKRMLGLMDVGDSLSCLGGTVAKE